VSNEDQTDKARSRWVAKVNELKDARRCIEDQLEESLDSDRLKQIIDVALSTEIRLGRFLM
jgi:hypothetical protein